MAALRILHLEDGDADAELVLVSLAEAGLEAGLIRATDGASFEAALARGPWDLILADFNVPRLDGLGALAKVRALDKEVPFICVTGTIGEEKAVDLLRSGATDYVLKKALPKLPMAIRRALEEAGEKRRAAKAELALAEKEALLRKIVETIDEVFWVLTPALDRVLYVSPGFERIWARPQAQALSDYSMLLDAIEPEDRAAVQAFMARASTQPQEIQHRIRRPDGKLRWIRTLTYPARDDSGKVLHIVAVSSDITGLKEMEQKFMQAQKMEAVGRLAGGIAHDFNNLLTVINGYGHLLQEQLAPDDPVRAKLGEIQDAGRKGAALTRQLLTFSRKQMVEARWTDLNAVVSGFEGMMRRIVGEDIALETFPGQGLWPTFADPGQLEQVIMNLVVNSRDAMPRGGKLRIETSNVGLAEGHARDHLDIRPGPHVLLTVSDTGTGMSEEVRSHLFEPFFTTKEAGKGTGLGLSTVWGIVKQAGGHVSVYSEPGQGTTFKVYLPRYDGQLKATEKPARPAAPTRGTETILLAEDSEVVRRLAAEVLQQAGYRLLQAGDGREALEVLRAHPDPIHLLLTDTIMPEMDGRELRRLAVEARPGMKIILISGYPETTIKDEHPQMERIAFLEKPFTPNVLTRKVREVLDGPGAAP